MRLCAFLLVLAVSAPLSAAPPSIDPYERASFARAAKGSLAEVVFLGFSADGKKLAYVRVEVQDGSGFLVIDAVELSPSTGKELDRFRFHGQACPGEPLVMKQKKHYEAFLARMKTEGISRDHAKVWTREGARFVAPDGKLALRWRVGRERGDAESETASGRVYAAALEDEVTSDHVVLFELFAGRAANGIAQKAPPKFTEVWSSSDGDGLVVLAHAEGREMCWNDDTIDVQAYSLGKLRVGRPARDLNKAGMVAYRAGQLRDAQTAFRLANAIDPQAYRARYNLAAVSAKLGDDAEALTILKSLVERSAELVKFKIATDEDFAEARKREPLAKYFKKIGIWPENGQKEATEEKEAK